MSALLASQKAHPQSSTAAQGHITLCLCLIESLMCSKSTFDTNVPNWQCLIVLTE